MKTVTCGIVGPGAVGTALGFFLSEMASCRVGYLNRAGACVHGARVRWQGVEHQCQWEIVKPEDWDVAFIAVKAYQVRDAMLDLRQKLQKPVPVINLSNGMLLPELETLAPELAPLKVRAGLVTYGVKGGRSWEITDRGEVRWGPLSADEATPIEVEVTEKLSNCGFSWRPDIAALIYEKWLLNTVLNTLCTVKRLNVNGEALKYKSELATLMEEACALGKELWGKTRPTPEDALASLLALIAKTSTNENSMVRDIKRGKPTERAYLSGLVEGAEGSYPLLRKFNRLAAHG